MLAGAQAGEVVAENDVQDPMQPVLDLPMGAHGVGKAGGVAFGRGQIVAAGDAGRAGALDLGFDHHDGLEAGKAGLAGVAAVGQPSDIATDGVMTGLDPAMIAIGVVSRSRAAAGVSAK